MIAKQDSPNRDALNRSTSPKQVPSDPVTGATSHGTTANGGSVVRAGQSSEFQGVCIDNRCTGTADRL